MSAQLRLYVLLTQAHRAPALADLSFTSSYAIELMISRTRATISGFNLVTSTLTIFEGCSVYPETCIATGNISIPEIDTEEPSSVEIFRTQPYVM